MYQKTHWINTIAQFLTLPFMLLTLALLIGALLTYDGNRQTVDVKAEKDTVVKYAIQCYASEGSYPPDIAYLEEHYGLQIDHDRFIYYYDAFASNVLPDIRVVTKVATGTPLH